MEASAGPAAWDDVDLERRLGRCSGDAWRQEPRGRTVRRTGMLLRLLALLSVVLLTGCAPASDRVGLPSALSGGGCPSGVDPLADWVSFVQHDGVQYQQNWPLTPVPEDQLGPVVGTVTCQRSTSSRGADQPARDGDAAYLPAGTELRALTDVDPALRLAVRTEDGWEVYDAFDVAAATTGAELLDLRDIVRVSLVESEHGKDVVRSVTAVPDVAKLVEAIRSAPVVSQEQAHQAVRGPLWFVRFELAHGPPVQRAWYPDGGVLFPRITAPPLMRGLLQV